MIIIFVGDIAKLATKTLQFSLRRVLVNFVLPGNLSNSQLKVVERFFNSMLTLSKSPREESMLSTGTFSVSESEPEVGVLEGLRASGAILSK